MKNYKKYCFEMNIFKRKTPSRKGLEHQFTYAGHHFYTFPKMEASAAKRYLAYIRFVREHELGVSTHDLNAFIEGILDACKKGDIGTIGTYCHTLRAFLDLYTDHKRLFEVSNCFVLIDDEPIKDLTGEHTLLKWQLFEASEEVRFFFIDTGLKYLSKVKDLPKDFDAANYLRSPEVQLAEKVFSNLTESSSLVKSKQS